MKNNKKFIVIILVIIVLVSLVGYISYQSNFGYFINGSNMSTSRAYHQSILFNNDDILITGGINSPQNENVGIQSAEIYSIDKKFSKTILETNLPHLYHKMFNMSDGNIVIADINGIEIFDVDTKTFKLLKTKPEKRYPEFNNYKFVLLPNDTLLILGGRYECNKNGNMLCDKNSGEIIDIKKDKICKRFSFKGNGFGLITLEDGKILIIGGKYSDKNKELLSDKIYLFEPETTKLHYWGNLTVPMVNPFVFKTSNNKLVVLGGEIEKGYVNWQGYQYLQTQGTPIIEIIDLNTKQTETIDISNILKQKRVYENKILDVVQYTDNLYWLQLKSTEKNNSLLIDINTKKTENLIQSFFIFNSRYRSSNIKLPNGILITGGKLMYQEPTELDISLASHPEAKEQNNAESNRFIENSTIILKIR